MPRHPLATPLLAVLAIVVLGLGIGLLPSDPTSPSMPPAAPVQHAARTVSAPAAAEPQPAMVLAARAARTPSSPSSAGSDRTPPARVLLSTDPTRAPHRIDHALARYIGAVPAGASIKVETYFIQSQTTVAALAAAYRRGVHVQIIVTEWHHEDYPDETRLARLLGTDRSAHSWLHWAEGASRGGADSSIDHDKVWRFSQVGRRRWVTVVGSYNNSDTSDAHAYALALSVASKPIYERFEQMWSQSRADRPVADPTRSAHGDGWDAYWLPGTRLAPSADPAVRRLRAIPARHGTVLHIRMFSMFGVRGGYVTDQLVRMARRGVRIAFIAGPTVDEWLQHRLRTAGVDVQSGCWRDGTYDHAKDMSATWVRHGERHYETWVGSDNWNDNNYLYADQVELGLTGRRLYNAFGRDFQTIARRPDVPQRLCSSSGD